ncbi:MAG: ABC transporter substrate-binding protein [Desulfobacteraceae bacterium]|nr:ABC transporter substrate-binding protein [Desulfobacteraceae bacterium]
MKQNRILNIFIIVIFIFLMSSSSSLSKTYTLGLVEWAPWATAYVAEQKGFWKSEGLDVQITQFSDYENGNVKAFKYGKIDFAIMMLGSAVNMIEHNSKYTIIYEHCWSHGGDYFILSSELTDISQLEHRKIGMYSKSLPVLFFLQKILGKSDLSLKNIDLLEVSNTANLNRAFRKGIFSAIISYDPEASNVIKDKTGKLLFTSADFPGVIPEGIVTQNSILANQKEYFEILKKTMFKDSPYSIDELKAFQQGGRIHNTLEQISQANQSGIQYFLKDLLLFMHKDLRHVRIFDINEYISTSIAIDEAEKIFNEKK